jgi:hypothetical protein
MFEMDEETQEMKPVEDFAMPGTEELKSLEVWSHKHQLILKAGRCTHEPVGATDEEKEEYMAKMAEIDKTEERFRAINEDSKVQSIAAWSSKISGDTQQYNKMGGEGTSSYAVNVIRSNRWPGALTVAKGGKYYSLYIGDAVKKGDACFNPTEPPSVEKDPADPEDQPEPQGKEKVAVAEAPAEGEPKEE